MKVRHLRDAGSQRSSHGSLGNIYVNAMTGDKWVDPYMYPGICVDHCNSKGVSAHQTTKTEN